VKRREFITVLGGAATWPLAARAQQPAIRRIGVLSSLAADDPEGLARVTAFVQGLQELGWASGRNARIEYRWAAADPDRLRQYADELAGLRPDVVLAAGTPAVLALQGTKPMVPIVFVQVIDPVGSGLVASLRRPGGNATGFVAYEYGMAAKWPELLKQIAPQLSRVAVVRDPALSSGIGQLAAIQASASSFGMELRPVDLRDVGEMERAIAAFAREPTGGLIVPSSPLASVHRKLIIGLAAKHGLPSVYTYRYYVADGGLICYGPDSNDQHRRAAAYVDRILKGEKPADLPVQTPVKYEMTLNLRTAKALGLEVPATLLARADEVIE
jgi:putative ABC transport system substrate-binding protein